MQLVNQPTPRNETLLGGEQTTDARPSSDATQAQAPETSASENTGAPALPPHTPSIRYEMITAHTSRPSTYPLTCCPREAFNDDSLPTTNPPTASSSASTSSLGRVGSRRRKRVRRRRRPRRPKRPAPRRRKLGRWSRSAPPRSGERSSPPDEIHAYTLSPGSGQPSNKR